MINTHCYEWKEGMSYLDNKVENFMFMGDYPRLKPEEIKYFFAEMILESMMDSAIRQETIDFFEPEWQEENMQNMLDKTNDIINEEENDD